MRAQALTAVATLAASAMVGLAPAAHAADSCVGVRFVALRGSGEEGGATGNTAKALYNDIKGFAPTGVTTALTGVDYAAVGLPNLWDKLNLYRYQSSKSGGVRNLKSYLAAQSSCIAGGEKWVFLGFSQGAHVIGDSLSSDDGFFTSDESSATRAVVLIADPRFNSKESYDTGTYQSGRNGLLGARSLGDLDGFSGKVKSWCDAKDLVCQSYEGYDGSVHNGTRYESAHKDAMVSFLRTKLGWLPSGDTTSGYTGNIDVALAIDTTGSMGGYIDQVKSSSIDLFNDLAHSGANARMAVIDYKDAEYDAYGAQVDLPFTSDATQFQNAVNGLSADGGGDTPEYVLSGVQKAIDGLTWRAGAKKIIIPIGDAAGKDPEPIGGLTTAAVLQHAYDLDPAQLYPLVLDPDADATMKALADGSAGTVFEVSDPTTVADVLSKALLTAVSSPVAVLSPVNPVQPGTEVTLSAADSFDPDPTETLDSYDWDFNGDGVVDATTTVPTVSHLYADPFDGTAAVTVTNSSGIAATGSTPVLVTTDTAVAPADVPDAVTNLLAVPSGTGVDLSWTPPPGAVEGYGITLLNKDDGSVYELAGAPGDSSSATLDDVDPGDYVVVLSPFNQLGNGAPRKAAVKVTTKEGQVQPPSEDPSDGQPGPAPAPAPAPAQPTPTPTPTATPTESAAPAPSATATATPGRVKTTLVLSSATPTRLVSGVAYTVKGQLRGGNVGGQPIALSIATSGHATRIVSLTTTSGGLFSYGIRPTYTTQVVATFAGSDSQLPARSNTRRTLVSTLVTISSPASGSSTRVRALTLTGSTTPNKAGQRVSVYERRGSSFVKIGSAVVSSTGGYAFSHLFSRGTHVLQVRIGATASNAAGSSATSELREV